VELQKAYLDVLERERAEADRQKNQRDQAEREGQRASADEKARQETARVHAQEQAAAANAQQEGAAQRQQAVRLCTQRMFGLVSKVPHAPGFGGEMAWMNTAANACQNDPTAADRLQQQLDLGIQWR
jgi:hypothetical protein